MLAYQTARAVREAAGGISADEQVSLTEMQTKLALQPGQSGGIEDEVQSLSLAPLESGAAVPSAPDNSGLILKYSILNDALQLLPETLATMAIIPMQMKMVYRIGKSHGVELDRSDIKDFPATAGAGPGSQVIEGFARKLLVGFGKKIGGQVAGIAASQVSGSAFSFGSTYAIGHVAESYCSGVRHLVTPDSTRSVAAVCWSRTPRCTGSTSFRPARIMDRLGTGKLSFATVAGYHLARAARIWSCSE
jgi:uncharacterized protein (DUF697 family)